MPAAEQREMLAHIEFCRDCDAELESVQSLRMALGRLNRAPMPEGLTDRLRVLASHERVRQLARASLHARLRDWSGRFSLLFDNLMRPLAFPFAGGLVSAVIIFGLLVPSLTFLHRFADQTLFTDPNGEVVVMAPSGSYMPETEADNMPRIERADASIPETANVVDVTIDSNGRVCDWSVARGELTPDLINIIMLGQFSPATNLGVPIAGKLKLVQIRTVQTAPIQVRS